MNDTTPVGYPLRSALPAIDRHANLSARLLAIANAHTTTIAGQVVTKWAHGYEIGTYAHGPMLTLDKAVETLLKGK
jgi:hypothetical protein